MYAREVCQSDIIYFQLIYKGRTSGQDDRPMARTSGQDVPAIFHLFDLAGILTIVGGKLKERERGVIHGDEGCGGGRCEGWWW